MALLRLNNYTSIYKIYTNIPFSDDSARVNRLTIKSQHTNDLLYDIMLNFGDGNNRYTFYEMQQFGGNPYQFDLDKDVDGIYNYEVQTTDMDDEGEIINIVVYDKGLIKIEVERPYEDKYVTGYINKDFKSDNEEGKSRVLYKPI